MADGIPALLAAHAEASFAEAGDVLGLYLEPREDAREGDAAFVQPRRGLEVPLRHRHADGGTEAAPERSGGDVHAGGVAVFRMPRRQAPPLAEVFDT